MKTMTIKYVELTRILNTAKVQLKDWIETFEGNLDIEPDKKELEKVEELLEFITEGCELNLEIKKF